MLYNKSNDKTDELFKNPPNEYRAIPFWAWNCRLENDMMKRQIECFSRMGFGGFMMHTRQGLKTKYLSDEYMDCVRFCVEEGKKYGMFSWLYDEDKWPSGFAGGQVTKNPKYRQRALYITKCKNKLPNLEHNIKKAIEEGLPYPVGCYDIEFADDGNIKSYKLISENENGNHEKYFAFSDAAKPSDWYNFQTYTDIMQDEAIGKFIETTHNKYYNSVGKYYGTNIPAIFTDEPRQVPLEEFVESDPEYTAVYHWTYNFDKSFKEKYGYDIIECLPEIFWNMSGKELPAVRYDYFNHICNMFVNSYTKQISDVTKRQGIALTGHLMAEGTLYDQLKWTGDAMRHYPYFEIPGMDLLADNLEFITAKQVQSVVHQYGKENMVSEMYGVTGWDFDFKSLKMQGDWQAALGVTIRVPHLSLMSMGGMSKRDYPPSMNYQVPWHNEYKIIEDHFARLKTILTRGKAIVNIAVLHPIETTMLRICTKEKSYEFIKQQDADLQNIVNNLLYSAMDFDFICEANLPNQDIICSDTIKIGKSEYKAIIIPPVDTIRRTTLNILTSFAEKGGKIIFTGKCPKYIDGRKSNDAKSLYEKSVCININKTELINAVETEREISIRYDNGTLTDNLIYQLRSDDDCKWLFIAHAERIGKHDYKKKNPVPQKIHICINGEYSACIYDTINGKIKPVEYNTKNKKTYINYDMYANDSLLLKLYAYSKCEYKENVKSVKTGEKILLDSVKYRRSEPNVALLDMCKYSYDGINYNDTEYVLTINSKSAEKFNISYSSAQPYMFDEETFEHKIYLNFEFDSEAEFTDVLLGIENAGECNIKLNEEKAESKIIGYYVDEAIKTITLPKIKKGKNILNIETPFNSSKGIEACYLLGDFNVDITGCRLKLSKPTEKIGFGSLTSQGMPFYGGNVTYIAKAYTPNCTAKIKIPDFMAPCVGVYIDKEFSGLIAFSPFCIEKKLSEGMHTFEFVCFGNRNNTFGPVHNSRINDNDFYIIPRAWFNTSETWKYSYFTQNTGILSSPVIEFFDK